MKSLTGSVQIQTFSKDQECEILHSISYTQKMLGLDLLKGDTEKFVIPRGKANFPSL
jgi:hypothetical protein